MSSRVDGREAVQQPGAEVDVDAVRLVCELASLAAPFALGLCDRILGRAMAPASRLLALCLALLDLLLELDAASDRLLDQFAI